MNEKELVTVLTALRHWQDECDSFEFSDDEHFLTSDEIDLLCEDLNGEAPDYTDTKEKIAAIISGFDVTDTDSRTISEQILESLSAAKPAHFFDKIDWELLRKQKMQLLSIITVDDDRLMGIVHFLDGIQDYAVDMLGWDENEVFTLGKEGEC